MLALASLCSLSVRILRTTSVALFFLNMKRHIPCELVFQSLDALPEGFTCPEGRTKPWGTNHALMMGASVINEPFAVLNCDDFYDRDAFRVMGKWLSELPEGSTGKYAMVGFRVGNTLSESGTVSRGVCENDEHHHLTSVVERTKIQRFDGVVKYLADDNETWVEIPDTTPQIYELLGLYT